MIVLSILIAALCVIGTGTLVARSVNRKIDQAIDRKADEIGSNLDQFVRSFVESPDPSTPSPIAQTIDGIGATFARAMMRESAVQAKAEQSHVSRVANQAAQDIQAYNNPLVALISGNKRGKNAAVARLAEMLVPMLNQQGGGNHQGIFPGLGGPGSSGEYKPPDPRLHQD